MCDGRSYNWEKGGRDVGVFALAEENLIFGRERGIDDGLWNFTEINASWVGERGLIAQMEKI